MKKFGIAIFIAALIIGVVVANLISVGEAFSPVSFNFSFSDKIKGSGKMAVERRDVAEFDGVDAGGIFKVEVVAGKERSVEIEADDNLLRYIRTEVRNGVLELSTEERIKSENAIIVRISSPEIRRVETSGVANMNVSGIANEILNVSASGASKITVAGETARLNIDASGASSIRSENLTARIANVDLSGASNASVNAVEELTADASGAASIRYAGEPASIKRSTSGAGSITQQ